MTNKMNISINKVSLMDSKSWQHLWRQYLIYYKSEDFSTELTDLLWQRIHSLENPINCFIAKDLNTGEMLGFTHFSSQVTTWQKEPECYLEDLFVLDKTRGQGVGQLLINAVVDHAKEKGWRDVYWQTQFDNEPARGLYDKITGGTNGYVIYRIDTETSSVVT